jgi:hypothetical protein
MSIAEIDQSLRLLPSEKLPEVYRFVLSLLESPAQTAFASEAVLARDWNLAIEDETWADL